MDANADLSIAIEQWFSDAIESRGTDWAVVGELLVRLAGACQPLYAVEMKLRCIHGRAGGSALGPVCRAS